MNGCPLFRLRARSSNLAFPNEQVISLRVILYKGIGTVEHYQQPTLEPETPCFAPEQDRSRWKELFSYTVFGLPISPKDDLIPFHRPPLLECKERSNTFTESRIMEDLLGIISCEFHCIACRDAYRLDELPTLCLH